MLILTTYGILLVLMFVLGFRPCYEGYFSEKIGQCIKCPDNCVFCDSDKFCLTCANGYWGNVCERPCSECKEGTSCEKTNGFCLEKCKDGFTGLLCDAFCSATCLTCDRMNASLCEICLNKLQGKFCEKPCPQFCMNSSCNKTGYCIEDCENGYWGPICSELCPLGCKGKSCDRANGTCVNTGIDKENEQSRKADTGTLAVVSLVCVGSFMFVTVIICLIFYRCKIARCCEEGGQNNSDRENKWCIKKTKGDPEKEQPTVSTAEEAETLIQQIPAGQKGSSEFLYVSGFRGDNTYLVCQDPSAEQGDAFWEMVWQKNCNVIVKLSSSVEETRERELFLSKKKETQKHGSVSSLSATCIGVRDFGGYEERQYELEKQRERKKQVTQMQFSHWPRDGVPENLPKLLEFCQKIKEITTQLTGSLLVQCTGGQSRSYTYIALDKALKELEREDNADIHVEEYMDKVRDEGLISDEQYAFIRRTTDIWRASRATQIAAGSKCTQIEEDVSNQEWPRQHIPAGPQSWFELRFVSDLCGVSKYLICQDTATEKGKTFWEILWQKHCGVIVNFIGNVEETDENVFFLKKNERQMCGSVRVAFVRGTAFEGYEERQYELEKLTERKQVKQMQFSRWPRGGFPENLPKLLEFRQKIEKVRIGLTGPLLIHCSGEQSRSYTYIALDRMLNEIERGNNSDLTVEQILKRIGAQRLVSSNEQVSFLQKAVDIWRASWSTQTGKIVESKYLQIEGQDVSNQDKCLSCLKDSHKAFSEHRHVFGFSGDNEYIICKDPTEKDAAAFWEMVWQQNCCVIVTLRTMNEMSSKNTYRYWPFNSRTTTYDSISVTTARTHNSACFIHRTLEMKKLNDERQVTQIQFIDWLPGNIPKNRRNFFQFRQEVQDLSKDLSGPLLVHCSDGKSRSDLYTASDMVLTDLERKNHVQHYLAQIRGKGLELSENQTKFLSSIIELWKPSREEQTTSEKPAQKHYLDFEQV